MVVPEFVRIPGEMFAKTDVLHAHDDLLKTSMTQLLLFLGLIETLIGIPALKATMEGEREAGEFGLGGPFRGDTPEQLKRKQVAELKNGRLAMLAFGGMVTQGVIVGHGYPFF